MLRSESEEQRATQKLYVPNLASLRIPQALQWVNGVIYIHTKRTVRIFNWEKIITTEFVINAINTMTEYKDVIHNAPTVADVAVQSEHVVHEDE